MTTKKLLFVFTLLTSSLYAQTNTLSKPASELERCTSENKELSKQNTYYKETLHSLKPIRTTQVDGMEIDITSVIGSSKDNTITVTFLYKNMETEIRRYFQCNQAYFVDPQGNQTQTYEVAVSFNKGIMAENITPNIPIKGSMVFKSAENQIPLIRQLTLSIYPKISMSPLPQAYFENLEVIWK